MATPSALTPASRNRSDRTQPMASGRRIAYIQAMTESLSRTLIERSPLLLMLASIAVLGTADPRALSTGISRAVLTTMAGLMIALPGLYMVNVVERRIRGIMDRLSLESTPAGAMG